MNGMGEVCVSTTLCMGGGKERREAMEEYEMVNPVHHGEFGTGSSFAWQVRTNTTPRYSGGSTREKSQPESRRQSSSQGPPATEQPALQLLGKPHFCLAAPIPGRAALARFVALGCRGFLPGCKHAHSYNIHGSVGIPSS